MTLDMSKNKLGIASFLRTFKLGKKLDSYDKNIASISKSKNTF